MKKIISIDDIKIIQDLDDYLMSTKAEKLKRVKKFWAIVIIELSNLNTWTDF